LTSDITFGSGYSTVTFPMTNPITTSGSVVIAGAQTNSYLNVNGTNALTVGGLNAWSAGKSGTGTLVVAGPSNLRGDFFNLNAGTLILSHTAALSGAAPFEAFGSSTLQATVNLSAGNGISNVFRYRNSSGVTLTVSGTQSIKFTSPTVSIRAGSGGNSLQNDLPAGRTLTFTSGTVALKDNGDASSTAFGWTITGSGATVIEDQIVNTLSGTGNAGALIKTGVGVLTLSGSNSYTGVTTVGGGLLRLNAANALPGGIGTTGGLSNMTISGSGVLGLAVGDFARPLGTGSNAAQITTGGGFAAFGSDRTVNLGGSGAAVTWGVNSFMSTASGTLAFGHATSDKKIDFQNPIVLNTTANNVATRTISVARGTGAASVDAELSGLVSDVSGTGAILKLGSGVLALSNAGNSFKGKLQIGDGAVQVSSLNDSGNNSPIGVAGTIDLGNLATGGTFRYVGSTSATTNRIFNLSGTTGGGGIEAGGTSSLVVTSTVTSANGAKTLTLTGTSTAANEIRSINNPTTGNVSVVKDGPGLWRLTGTSGFGGGVTVKNGTLVAGVDTNGGTDAGVFGTSDTVIVGDESSGAAGTASLLLAPGVVSNKLLRVPATTGTQTVVLGGEALGATPSFENEIRLGRDVTLVAVTGGTTSFGNSWLATGSAPLSANVTIGSAGRAGAVRLANDLATTGSVAVRFGTLDVLDARTLSASGIVGIDGNATLAGVGRVAATLGGAGLVAPGNSPGILTAGAVDPTGGLDWAFEFTNAAPSYGDSSNSLNDILRLTGTASSPFTTALTSANEIAVYLDVASLAEGNTFRGGFFTDLAGDFRSSIANAAYTYWVSGTGAGQTTYLSKTYVPLATAYPSLAMDVTTVATTATFSGESATNGQVTTFTVVVPEPGALALAALGLGLAGYALRRRRAA
jgi:autotransporter-associated beta strand protein